MLWALLGSGAYFLWLIGRFALGYLAGLGRVFERDGAAHPLLFRRMLVIGGAITAVFLAFFVAVDTGLLEMRGSRWLGLVFATIQEFGLLAQTAFYVAIVVVLLQRARWRRLLGIVAPVGRMPLTTTSRRACSALRCSTAGAFTSRCPARRRRSRLRSRFSWRRSRSRTRG